MSMWIYYTYLHINNSIAIHILPIAIQISPWPVAIHMSQVAIYILVAIYTSCSNQMTLI